MRVAIGKGCVALPHARGALRCVATAKGCVVLPQPKGALRCHSQRLRCVATRKACVEVPQPKLVASVGSITPREPEGETLRASPPLPTELARFSTDAYATLRCAAATLTITLIDHE